MKHLLLLLLCLAPLFFTGCYNRRALDRRPHKPVPKAPPRRNAARDDNQLFETIFHRKPQRYENSNLTPAERRLMEENDVRFDRDARDVRRKNRSNRDKDWVFGTKDGSYF